MIVRPLRLLPAATRLLLADAIRVLVADDFSIGDERW